MQKRIIAIDIDDVIADSTESLRRVVNDRVGANLQAEDYRIAGDYWGYYERVWSAHGLSDSVPMESLNNEMIIDQAHIPLLPGASLAMTEITKRFDVAVVTARNPDWEAATLKWLQLHFGDVFISVHFAGGRHDESGRTKGELCQEVGAFMLIDDNVGHCQSATEQGLQAILFGEYGWHGSIPKDLVRCKNWPSVLEFIDAKV